MKSMLVKMSLLSITLLALPGCLNKKKEVHTKKVVKTALSDSGKGLPLGKKKKGAKWYEEKVEAFALSEIEDERTVVAQSAPLETLYFDFDSAKIRADQQGKLAYDVQIAKELAAKDSKIVVEGHSDKHFVSEAYNVAISQQRAHNVAKELTQAGVPADQVKAIGYGAEKLAVNTNSKEALNRRAELVVVPKFA